LPSALSPTRGVTDAGIEDRKAGSDDGVSGDIAGASLRIGDAGKAHGLRATGVRVLDDDDFFAGEDKVIAVDVVERREGNGEVTCAQDSRERAFDGYGC
jgi:hypothetical protein